MLGARYIGVEQADGKVIYAEPIYQVIIILYSYIVEITVPRAHYLVVPVVLGLIKLE